MSERMCCKGNGKPGTRCEYAGEMFCKHPDCKFHVMVSTREIPHDCPKYDEMNKRNKDGLKPCPFCGKLNWLNFSEETGDRIVIKCMNCDAQIIGGSLYDVVRKWNRRS